MQHPFLSTISNNKSRYHFLPPAMCHVQFTHHSDFAATGKEGMTSIVQMVKLRLGDPSRLAELWCTSSLETNHTDTGAGPQETGAVGWGECTGSKSNAFPHLELQLKTLIL